MILAHGSLNGYHLVAFKLGSMASLVGFLTEDFHPVFLYKSTLFSISFHSFTS